MMCCVTLCWRSSARHFPRAQVLSAFTHVKVLPSHSAHKRSAAGSEPAGSRSSQECAGGRSPAFAHPLILHLSMHERGAVARHSCDESVGGPLKLSPLDLLCSSIASATGVAHCTSLIAFCFRRQSLQVRPIHCSCLCLNGFLNKRTLSHTAFCLRVISAFAAVPALGGLEGSDFRDRARLSKTTVFRIFCLARPTSGSRIWCGFIDMHGSRSHSTK